MVNRKGAPRPKNYDGVCIKDGCDLKGQVIEVQATGVDMDTELLIGAVCEECNINLLRVLSPIAISAGALRPKQVVEEPQVEKAFFRITEDGLEKVPLRTHGMFEVVGPEGIEQQECVGFDIDGPSPVKTGDEGFLIQSKINPDGSRQTHIQESTIGERLNPDRKEELN